MSERGSHPPRAVLFDLDGTLVDSFPGIASALRHVCAELGLGPVKESDLRALVGPPIQVGLQRHLGLTGHQLDEGIRIFRQEYSTSGVFDYSKYPGIEQMLLELRARGIALSIATSKLRSMAVAIVENAGWADLFDLVGGAEADGRHLKRDVIEWTMARISRTTHVLAMVGDRAEDIIASRDLGIPGIGVTWGYGTLPELDEAGASELVGSPGELLASLTRLG